MTMFGKRRHQQSKPQWREPAAEPSAAADKGAPAAEDTAPAPSLGEPAPVKAPSPAQPAKPAPRPDASAILNRQPKPPVRPDQGRRNGARRESAETADSKKLTVGRDIEVAGDIRACDRLVVEGRVEADLSDSKVLEVAPSGTFKGSAVIDVAEIAGRFEGDLTVRDRLYLRGTGRVNGTIRYGGLEIENGGRIGGTLVELSDDDLKRLGNGATARSADEPEASSHAVPMQRGEAAAPEADAARSDIAGAESAGSGSAGT